ncbi:MAG: histidinol-phosphatase, partial [Oscillospiraceae bacterium]|nr:histidinol-phosphatase [Oscillospiraceae bacterium]
MILRDYHVHTTFSDGKNTPEEMVLAAIKKGMTEIGFSDHSYTWFDESYCMKKEDAPRYRECIGRLKEKYKGQIKILCGIEQDFYSEEPTGEYDYVIGSVHYLKLGNEYIAVDESSAAQRAAAERYFGGDMAALAAEYFCTVGQVVERTNADIIGHFDLINIYNENGALFDESADLCTEALRNAANALVSAGKYFEINTGGIARGYRTLPYPSPSALGYLRSIGAKFVLSSDSHSEKTLCFG